MAGPPQVSARRNPEFKLSLCLLNPNVTPQISVSRCLLFLLFLKLKKKNIKNLIGAHVCVHACVHVHEACTGAGAGVSQVRVGGQNFRESVFSFQRGIKALSSGGSTLTPQSL